MTDQQATELKAFFKQNALDINKHLIEHGYDLKEYGIIYLTSVKIDDSDYRSGVTMIHGDSKELTSKLVNVIMKLPQFGTVVHNALKRAEKKLQKSKTEN